MTVYWNRCSAFLPSMAFPMLPVSFLDLIIHIFRLQKYVGLVESPLGLFAFSSLLSFIIVLLLALQNSMHFEIRFLTFSHSSLSWFLCFPWPRSLFPPTIYLSTTFSPETLHSFSSMEIQFCLTSPFQCTSLVVLIPCRAVSTHYSLFPYKRGQRNEQRGKGARETCSF